MPEELKVSKWGVGIIVTLCGLVFAITVQTALAFKWAGQVSERLDNLSSTVSNTKTDLTRRIERIEDRESRK